MLVFFYNTLLYQPLYNLLVFFYNLIPGNDIGLAIIALTILIRVILAPLSAASLKSQKSLQTLQPKIDQLKVKYKDDKEKMAQEMMKLYKEEKVNPLSSCLPLLIQLPIFIAVYKVFQSGLQSSQLNLLYPFISNPGTIKAVSLGLFDLSKPNVILAVLAGLSQFWQTKMLVVPRPPKIARDGGTKDEDAMAIVNKQMAYVLPVFTIIIGLRLPAGLSLYWLITTLLSILQQYYVLKKKDAQPRAATLQIPPQSAAH